MQSDLSLGGPGPRIRGQRNASRERLPLRRMADWSRSELKASSSCFRSLSRKGDKFEEEGRHNGVVYGIQGAPVYSDAEGRYNAPRPIFNAIPFISGVLSAIGWSPVGTACEQCSWTYSRSEVEGFRVTAIHWWITDIRTHCLISERSPARPSVPKCSLAAKRLRSPNVHVSMRYH